MFFDLIRNNLRSIHLQTKLLEACEWDEDCLSDNLRIAIEYFENYTPGTSDTWKDIIDHCRSYMKNNVEESLVDIIIEVLEHNKKEIIDIMNLEEN